MMLRIQRGAAFLKYSNFGIFRFGIFAELFRGILIRARIRLACLLSLYLAKRSLLHLLLIR